MYAELAQMILNILKSNHLDIIDEDSIRRVSVSCALFFEDYISGTHQMEVFMRWHQRKLGKPLPFYDCAGSESDDSVHGGSESAGCPASCDVAHAKAPVEDQLRFVLWHALCAESEGSVINPENVGLTHAASDIISTIIARGTLKRLAPNEQLKDHLYCEQTQSDIMEIKSVLIWIQHYSFLGYWYELPEDEVIAEYVDTAFSRADEGQRAYAIDSLSAFQRVAWPCSLRPQDIYADMIRMEMEDEDDPFAKDIQDIECRQLAIYKKISFISDVVLFQDSKGEQIPVRLDSFEPLSVRLLDQKVHFIGSFVKFKGEYHVNGMSSWLDMSADNYDSYREKDRQNERVKHMKGQYDRFISRNGGRRVYFFSDFEDFLKWGKRKLGIPAPRPDEVSADERRRMDSPIMLFFEPEGQFTLSSSVTGVKSPDNPYYDPAKAPVDAFSLGVSPEGCSPDCLLYLLEHGMLEDAAFKHTQGPARGRALFQDNAEFIARCFRRDIRDTE